MSTGVCGKRVGYDDFFGSSSSPTNKRSKWSTFGSPIRSSEIGSGSDDSVASLIHMFPTMDPEVRLILRNKVSIFNPLILLLIALFIYFSSSLHPSSMYEVYIVDLYVL